MDVKLGVLEIKRKISEDLNFIDTKQCKLSNSQSIGSFLIM